MKILDKGRAYGESEVTELFYPERGDEIDASTQKKRRRQSQRRKGFLRGLGDEDYDAVFRHIIHNSIHAGTRQSFPDVEGLLKTKKDEGQIMRRVMEHVVRWVNDNPTEVADNRDNNKPLLREDLKPALRLSRTLNNSGGREDACASEGTLGTLEEQAEVDSIILERRVLDAVRSGMESFKNPATLATLDVLPAMDRDRYADRFVEELWMEVLRAVQDMFGLSFKPVWKGTETAATGHGDETQKQPISAITRSLAVLAGRIPEISSNLALNSREALEELCGALDKEVTEWVVRRCGTALGEERARNAGQTRDEDAVQVIEAARQTYQSHLEKYNQPKMAAREARGVDGDYSAGASSSASSPPSSSPSSLLSAEMDRSTRKEGSLNSSTARGNSQAQAASAAAARARAREQPVSATLMGQSPGKPPREGPLSTRKQIGNNMIRQNHVECAPRRPLPLSPTRSTPVTADVKSGQGSPGKQPRLQTGSQRPSSHKKLRLRANDKLPSIADILANLNGNNNTHGHVTQTARRWDGPVAR